MRNFARINNYYNKIEAIKDWNNIAGEAVSNGHVELVLKFKPDESMGWRAIDARIEKLRQAIRDAEQCVHPLSGGGQVGAQDNERTTEIENGKTSSADTAPQSAGG